MRWTAGVCALVMTLGVPCQVRGQGTGNGDAARPRDGAPPPSADPWTLPPLPLGRIQGAVALDGTPDEGAWAALDALPVVQHWPVFQGPMADRTVIRVGYDDEYLYAAGWFYDDPEDIRGNSLQRDRWDGDDAFDLIIDSYNDDQTALKFTTTPLGILLDQTVQNDAQPGASGPPLNREWNTFWDVATTRTDEGWFAEVRIPLASLGFEVVDGHAVMGLIAARWIAGRDEKHIFPAIPPDRDMAEFMPSRARDVRLDGVRQQRPLWVTPYALVGVERIREPGAVPLAAPGTEGTREVGVDVKLGLSSNLTLDLTVNTDFAQAESDALEVNLDRFSLFLPEKRQFFQERASTFDFDMGEGRLFHSRRIGLSDDGSPRRILGGARLAGRMGAWDVGVLSMQVDDAGGAAAENDGVVRLRRAFGSGGFAGVMATSRARAGAGADVTAGADARFPVGEDLVTVQAGFTRDPADGARASLAARSTARVFWERRGNLGWAYDVDLSYSGKAYDPALGFEFRDDFRAAKARVRYGWNPGEQSPLVRAYLQLHGRAYARNEDGTVESALGRAQFYGPLRGGQWFNLALNVTRENVVEGFALPGADVPAGVYDGVNVFARFEMSPARKVGSHVTLWGGSAFDGRRTNVTLDPWWRISPHLTLGAMLSYHRIAFGGRSQTVNANQAALRVAAALDTRLSAEAFLQYSAARRGVATNVRLRYRFAEGRDLFVVLDETRDLEAPGADYVLLGRTDRRLLVKYSWAFRP